MLILHLVLVRLVFQQVANQNTSFVIVGIQVEVLKTSGCDHVQGNWFSMPLSAKEFEKMLSLPGEILCRCRKNEEHSTGGEA